MDPKFFWTQNFFSYQKFCSDPKLFQAKIIFSPKIFLDPNFFQTKNVFRPKTGRYDLILKYHLNPTVHYFISIVGPWGRTKPEQYHDRPANRPLNFTGIVNQNIPGHSTDTTGMSKKYNGAQNILLIFQMISSAQSNNGDNVNESRIKMFEMIG